MNTDFFTDDPYDSLLSEKIDETMSKAEEGIFPSPYGLYRMTARLLEKNSELCMDSEKILKTIIWELGPQLDSFPHTEYISPDQTLMLLHEKINQINLINLLINGLEAGNEFIKHLIVMLYRTYYPKLYKQYKRFSEADWNFVNSFLSRPDIDIDPQAEEEAAHELMLALLVALADDKKLLPEAYGYFTFAEYLDLHQTEEENEKKKQIRNKKYIDTIESMLKWLYDEESILSKELDHFLNLTDIMDDDGTSLLIRQYVDQLMYMPEYRQLFISLLYRTIEAASLEFPGKERPSQKRLAGAFIINIFLLNSRFENSKLNHELGYICGLNSYEGIKYSFTKYDEKKLKKHNTVPKDKIISKLDELVRQSPRDSVPEDKKIQELEQELSQIKQGNKSNERRMKNLRLDYEKVKDENDLLRKELEAVKSEHFENIKMREYLYGLTEADDLSEQEEDLKEEIQALRQSRIVIIGGHDNWTNKLRRIFPDWDYIATENYSTQTAAILNKADGVFFFTEYLSHKAYYKYLYYLRDHNLNFGYLHSVNIERTIKEIWKGLSGG